MARSDTAQKARPGGRANAFWLEASTTSRSQASISMRAPARPLTESTRIMMSLPLGRARMAWAISRTGLVAPVLVSLWTRVMASNSPVANRSTTCSGKMGWPQGTLRSSMALPFIWATSLKRSANAPLTQVRTFLLTQLRTAASHRPVPEEALMSKVCSVKKTWASLGLIAPMRSAHSGIRWPIIQRLWASRISGRTSVGPGMKSLMCWLLRGEEGRPES